MERKDEIWQQIWKVNLEHVERIGHKDFESGCDVGEAVHRWNLDTSVFGRFDDLARFESNAYAHPII